MIWVLTTAGLAMALVAGVFLSFSDFLMRGLKEAPDNQGAAGMVGLNRTVYRSAFMIMLMGLVPVSFVFGFVAFWQFGGLVKGLIIAGSVSYVVGVFLVTGFGNVPMNTRLDAMATDPQATAVYWPEYVERWTALNHIRTAASLFAAICWLFAALQI